MNGIFLSGAMTSTTRAEMLPILQWYHRCEAVIENWLIGDPVPSSPRTLVITTEPLLAVESVFPGAHVRTVAYALETVDRHREPGPDVPPFEHWTCATAHIRAERTLALIERISANDIDAMEMIAGLVEQAGPQHARQALLADNDVPF